VPEQPPATSGYDVAQVRDGRIAVLYTLLNGLTTGRPARTSPEVLRRPCSTPLSQTNATPAVVARAIAFFGQPFVSA
jgi:hypothetical protein